MSFGIPDLGFLTRDRAFVREGADQNRTGVRGFAGLCLTTRPRRRAAVIVASRFSGAALGYRRHVAREPSSDETAARLVPERPTLPKLRAAAAGCTACDLYRTATQ